MIDETLIFDSHAHLLDKRISSDSRVLDGVGGIICFYDPVVEDIALFKKFLGYRKIIGGSGVHPHNSSVFYRMKNDLIDSLELDKVMILGEIGLDYHWENAPRRQQRRVFIEQLKIAEKSNLPVAVHMREAFRDTMAILNDYAKTRVLIHCFSEGPEEVVEAVQRGYFIAFGGSLTFSGSEKQRRASMEVPFDKLLVETDSPYLAPQSVRGRTNVPGNVRYTIEALSHIKKVGPEKITQETFMSTLNFLGIKRFPLEMAQEEN